MDDRLQILKMVQEGKISPEEADRLLEALEAPPEARRPAGDDKEDRPPRFIHIEVTSEDERKVDVRVPIQLAKMALHFVPRRALAQVNGRELDVDELIRQVQAGASGVLVEVDEDEDHVRISIE
ncbi:SHOCT-like domain-containing protein [Limnochorda pilosa]|uniref:YvlB/LiaX N-terminal domain-containing protein n=1 Tax=Limnochorda pilosa TaxID=1555112 RepID=A0A0K2SP23_LIMPI|nr:hypothetical protein [Limnochorda pilosa]BAS28742.1 hypothetical protein LIP_2913 [Limnochorda pilosa]